jgi:hypothetical protein
MSRRASTIALAVALAASSLSCDSAPPGERIYKENDLQLLTAHAAKEMCSCVFVFGRDEDFCKAWVKAAPDLKTLRVDYDGKSVESQAVLLWGARARFVDGRRGCVLE